MFGALLPASDEGESKGDNAVFGSTHASAQSKFGDSSPGGWTQKTPDTEGTQRKKKAKESA